MRKLTTACLWGVTMIATVALSDDIQLNDTTGNGA